MTTTIKDIEEAVKLSQEVTRTLVGARSTMHELATGGKRLHDELEKYPYFILNVR